MAEPSAIYTVIEATDWEADDYIDYSKLLVQLLQSVTYIAHNHDHSGDAGDGGTLALSDPKAVWFFAPNGAPFA